MKDRDLDLDLDLGGNDLDVDSDGDETYVLENPRPLWVATLIVRHSFVLIAATFVLSVVVIVVIVSADLFKFFDNDFKDYAIRSESVTQNWFALLRAEQFVTVGDGKTLQQPVQSVMVDRYRLIVMYRAELGSDNVFTVDNIARMREVESALLRIPTWPQFCFAGSSTPNCSSNAYVSITKYIDAGFSQQQIDGVLQQMAGTMNTTSVFFGKSFGPNHPKSVWARAIFNIGGPFSNDGSGAPFLNIKDREIEQHKIADHFMRECMNVLDKLRPYPSMSMLLYGRQLLILLFRDQILQDLKWALGAVTFVWFYMAVHTRSMFLASMAMLEVLLAFPLGFIVYRLVLGIQFFQTLHVLAIFILLGIGADDVFVFTDAWVQSGMYINIRDDLELRMAYVWRRAAKAMLVTSSTTIGAFLATGISTIMPIASFGFWAASLILINYLLVVSYFAAVVVIWHRYFRGNVLGCLHCPRKSATIFDTSWHTPMNKHAFPESSVSIPMKSQPKKAPVISKHIASPGKENVHAPSDVCANGGNSLSCVSPVSVPRVERVRETVHGHRHRWIETFFRDKWSVWLNSHKKFVVAFFVGVTVVSFYLASRMSPLTDEEKWFPNDTYIARSLEASQNEFHKSQFDRALRVKIVWGIKGLDLSGTDRFDPQDFGRVVFDDHFDLAPPGAQESMIRICERFRSSPLVFQGLVTCPILDYKNWRLHTRNSTFPAVFSSTDPVLQRTLFTQDLHRFVREFTAISAVNYESQFMIGIDPGGRLRFVVIECVSPIPPRQPYIVTHPEYLRWEALVHEINESPDTFYTLNAAMETASIFWHRMVMEHAFVTNAIRGVLMAAGVAFIAMFLSTMNWIISLWAVSTIACVVGATMSVMYLKGFEFGVSESVSTVIVIGFSVDYIVHFANAYVECKSPTRFLRMRHALGEMGISVVAGAATTSGSSLFLFGATILFFYKFGVIMASTICFSLLYSTTYFAALCMLVGPEGNTGNMSVLFARCKRRNVGDNA